MKITRANKPNVLSFCVMGDKIFILNLSNRNVWLQILNVRGYIFLRLHGGIHWPNASIGYFGEHDNFEYAFRSMKKTNMKNLDPH